MTQTKTNLTVDRPPRRPPGTTYWLIARDAYCRIEVLTLYSDGQRILPVFSHEEEAKMYLRLAGMTSAWRARGIVAGELVSALRGPCAGVKQVALDPLPEMVAWKTVGLVSLDRELFVQRIVVRRSPRAVRGPGRGSLPRNEERDPSNRTDPTEARCRAIRPA